jgi:NADPH-dependent curcumin reductase CurA
MLDGPNATFKLVNTRLEPLRSSQVLLKAKYFSNDAAQRVWINASKDTGRLYVKPVEIGEVMRCSAIAEVIESRSTKFPKGSLVKTMNGWSEFTVQDEDKCTALLDTPGINVTHQLGALGIGGLTAYYGLVDVAKTSKRDTVVVSGAAGATGSMAVQVAKKIIGCEKVGIWI